MVTPCFTKKGALLLPTFAALYTFFFTEHDYVFLEYLCSGWRVCVRVSHMSLVIAAPPIQHHSTIVFFGVGSR